MQNYKEVAGFRGPSQDVPGAESRRFVVIAELAAITGLCIAIVIAVTVVTAGVARASVLDGVIDNDGGLFTIALLLGIIFIAIGGFSLLPGQRRPRH